VRFLPACRQAGCYFSCAKKSRRMINRMIMLLLCKYLFFLNNGLCFLEF
jgi:hypothetical protein